MSSTNPLPFIDLKSQYRQLKEKIDVRIKAVLEHGQYIMGPEVQALEEQLAHHVGVKKCITVSSGTDALLMSLMVLDIKEGDEVITTPFTFIATAEAIALLGAVPVFVDIDPQTYNIDPNKIEAAITKNTKAIIPVNLFGQCADFDAINAVAAKHNLFIIEDAAQSFGATYKGRQSGSLGRLGCTSFFPAKPLGCYGDGGAIFTDDEELAEKLVCIRVHGSNPHNKYESVRVGLNARFDTIQAAILLEKLAIFPAELQARHKIANQYNSALNEAVSVPYVMPSGEVNWALYCIQSNCRDSIQEALQVADIPSVVYYPKPLHLQPAFSLLGYKVGSFPVVEAVSQSILSLPMHPYLSDSQVNKVAEHVLARVEQQRETEGIASATM